MNSYIRHITLTLKAAFEHETISNQYAWWLLEKLTGHTKAELLLQPVILTQAQEQQLQDWLHQITVMHKPIAYILGTVPFGPLNIMVEPPVLIPRPETEEWVLNLITELQACKTDDLRILDLCTGSGCIALLLGSQLPHAQIVGIDICDDALNLAQRNKESLGIENVTFMQSDLFNELADMQFDLIVSNPPYITPDEYKQLDQSVKDWEAPHALMAEDEGLAIIRSIINQAPAHIKANSNLQQHGIKQLYIEIGWQQGNAVTKLMQKKGYTAITIEKDSADKDRVVCGRISNVASASDQ